jgi:hypothetical protein
MKSLSFSVVVNAEKHQKPSDDCALQLKLLPTRALPAMMSFRNAAAFSTAPLRLRVLNFDHERASSISRSSCAIPCCSKILTPTRNDHLDSKGMIVFRDFHKSENWTLPISAADAEATVRVPS